jgi:hypothetical protein
MVGERGKRAKGGGKFVEHEEESNAGGQPLSFHLFSSFCYILPGGWTI